MTRVALTEETAATMLAALGSPARLLIFKTLIRAGNGGLNVSALQRSVRIPASTLGHHLSTLVDGGLVAQHRMGRELICTARYDAVQELGAYLMAECCADAPE